MYAWAYVTVYKNENLMNVLLVHTHLESLPKKISKGGLKMFVVMFVLFVFAILCLCLFSFFRSLTKAMCEL